MAYRVKGIDPSLGFPEQKTDMNALMQMAQQLLSSGNAGAYAANPTGAAPAPSGAPIAAAPSPIAPESGQDRVAALLTKLARIAAIFAPGMLPVAAVANTAARASRAPKEREAKTKYDAYMKEQELALRKGQEARLGQGQQQQFDLGMGQLIQGQQGLDLKGGELEQDRAKTLLQSMVEGVEPAPNAVPGYTSMGVYRGMQGDAAQAKIEAAHQKQLVDWQKTASPLFKKLIDGTITEKEYQALAAGAALINQIQPMQGGFMGEPMQRPPMPAYPFKKGGKAEAPAAEVLPDEAIKGVQSTKGKNFTGDVTFKNKQTWHFEKGKPTRRVQ